MTPATDMPDSMKNAARPGVAGGESPGDGDEDEDEDEDEEEAAALRRGPWYLRRMDRVRERSLPSGRACWFTKSPKAALEKNLKQ